MTYLEKLKTDDRELKSLIFNLLDSTGANFCKKCPAHLFCQSSHNDLECRDMLELFLSLEYEKKMRGTRLENQTYRNEILQKVKDIISRNIGLALYGFFKSRNVVGDKMTLLLSDASTNIELYICYDWGYFELFGLSDEEMRNMSSFYSDKAAEYEKAHHSNNEKENTK